jgi:hypothetical protein
MRIFGLDFTSAPSARKPITCAVCELGSVTLKVNEIEKFNDFPSFERFLQRPGPWVAGLDFPFGQPAPLVTEYHWGDTWEEYTLGMKSIGKPRYVKYVEAYCKNHDPCEKLPRRRTDQRAGARSAMMVHGVPVGRMFAEGAYRLLESGVTVVPCHLGDGERVAVEAYPALVAKNLISNSSYKSAKRHRGEERAPIRQALVDSLMNTCVAIYGFTVEFPDSIMRDCVQDYSGDTLDAVLCAVQAAWSSRQKDYGVPEGHAFEGWIVDPVMAP